MVDAFGVGADQAASLIRDRIGGQSYTIYIDAIITSVTGGGSRGGGGDDGSGDYNDGSGKPRWEDFTVPPQQTTTSAPGITSGPVNDISVVVNIDSIDSDIDVEEMSWTIAREIQSRV